MRFSDYGQERGADDAPAEATDGRQAVHPAQQWSGYGATFHRDGLEAALHTTAGTLRGESGAEKQADSYGRLRSLGGR